MTTTQRRIALLTGASLATLVTAAPAAAATTSGPPIQHTGLVGAPNLTDTITICAIGNTCTVGVQGQVITAGSFTGLTGGGDLTGGWSGLTTTS